MGRRRLLLVLLTLLLGWEAGVMAEIPKHQVRILCRQEPDCRLTLIARLENAPFPYRGLVGDTKTPFFDRRDPDTQERLHSIGPELAYPERPHYSDNRVLIHVPPHFKPNKPFEILVFFHGHGSELERTLVGEFDLPGQVNRSHRNLILVAPQLALDAKDSSPGKLYRQDGLRKLLDEANRVLVSQLGGKLKERLATAPMLLAAYSGGYRALAFSLDRGGVTPRVKGVLLLDALYGELDKYTAWLGKKSGSRLLINLYGTSTWDLSEELNDSLARAGRKPIRELPPRLRSGQLYALAVETPHERIAQDGPPVGPLGDRKSTRLNSSHNPASRMPSSA
jgi:hypothetical protein